MSNLKSFWIRIKLPTGGWVDREYTAPIAWIALQWAEEEFGPGVCSIVDPKGVDKELDNRSGPVL